MKKLMSVTRYVVFVPAIASIIGALLLMAQGSYAMVMAVIDTIDENYALKETIVEVLTAVDAILLGTVLLVIGYGLYELFIDAELDVPLWLRVNNLDDLKSSCCPMQHGWPPNLKSLLYPFDEPEQSDASNQICFQIRG